MGLLAQTFQTSVNVTGGIPTWFWPVYSIVIIFLIASIWKVFVKAGHPGWAALVPFYNIYIMVKVSGRPGWWFWLLLIPFVNFVILIIVYIDVAKAFGKGTGFGIGIIFLSFIFLPILAWGSATYQLATPEAASPATPPA